MPLEYFYPREHLLSALQHFIGRIPRPKLPEKCIPTYTFTLIAWDEELLR
jgi:hypothetical protein